MPFILGLEPSSLHGIAMFDYKDSPANKIACETSGEQFKCLVRVVGD